jgi:hypothetical protein
MIVGVFQPYFFPYIGYFQLMNKVDVFVFCDDVQYIRHGWVNRNRILVKNTLSWLIMPVVRAPYELNINQRNYLLDMKTVDGLVNKVASAYRKAPYFKQIFPFIETLLRYENTNIAAYNQNLLISLAQYLGLTCKFEISSLLEKDNALKAQDLVIEICSRLQATQYVNPIGGLELYDQPAFEKVGIALHTIKTRQSDCPQFG